MCVRRFLGLSVYRDLQYSAIKVYDRGSGILFGVKLDKWIPIVMAILHFVAVTD